MDRRAFLGSLIGGVAATAAVRTWPFRVFSFPSEVTLGTLPATSIRFIRAYDVIQDRIISRFDVLYGFGQGLALPEAADAAYSITSTTKEPLSVEDLKGFANRYGQGKFPVELLTERIPGKGSQWIQKAWDFTVPSDIPEHG